MTNDAFYDGLAPLTLPVEELNRFVSIHDAVALILQNLSALLCIPEQQQQHLAEIRKSAANIRRHARAPRALVVPAREKEAADD